MVLSYIDVLAEKKRVGRRVAIIGAGGIGFDVAHYLTHPDGPDALGKDDFLKIWGIDPKYQLRGGLSEAGIQIQPSKRQVFLLQRSHGKVGERLGKTTGWILRLTLNRRGVQMINGVIYRRIDDQGLHITVNDEERLLEVDNVVICAGQEPLQDLYDTLSQSKIPVHLIGGAERATGLDAKRAIDQGVRLAAEL